MTGQAPGPASESTARDRPLLRRLLRLWLNLGLMALAVGLALGACELVVRVAAPQQLIQIRPDIWQPMDSVGWSNRPGVRTTINTGERTVHLYTDSLGLRVGESGRRDAPTRVLLIGDSFMEALQVEHEQTAAALLERRLAAQLGRPVSVWNAGVDGWDPPQYLIRTRQLLALQTFDLVVVALYLGNDVVRRADQLLAPRMPAERHRFRLRGLKWRDLVSGVFYPINDALEVRSHLYILLKNGLRPLLIGVRLTAEYFPTGLLRSESGSPRWDVTAEVCAEIARAAAARGTPTLFVLIPEPYTVDSAALEEVRRGFGVDSAEVDLEQPTMKMLEALGRRGLTSLPLLDPFREAVARGVSLYGRVDRHLTPDGHQLLADVVAPRSMLEMERRPASADRPRVTRPGTR